MASAETLLGIASQPLTAAPPSRHSRRSPFSLKNASLAWTLPAWHEALSAAQPTETHQAAVNSVDARCEIHLPYLAVHPFFRTP